MSYRGCPYGKVGRREDDTSASGMSLCSANCRSWLTWARGSTCIFFSLAKSISSGNLYGGVVGIQRIFSFLNSARSSPYCCFNWTSLNRTSATNSETTKSGCNSLICSFRLYGLPGIAFKKLVKFCPPQPRNCMSICAFGNNFFNPTSNWYCHPSTWGLGKSSPRLGYPPRENAHSLTILQFIYYWTSHALLGAS